MKWLRWASIGLSILGGAIGLASNWVEDKLLDERIEEKIAELSNKEES